MPSFTRVVPSPLPSLLLLHAGATPAHAEEFGSSATEAIVRSHLEAGSFERPDEEPCR